MPVSSIMPHTRPQTIIETRNVTRIVGNGLNSITTVADISYAFNKGEIYSIVGPSGAGKSSFLRLLNRLDDPSEGEILFHNKLLATYPPTELRKKAAMIFQIPYLFPGTVKDNLEYCCRFKKSPDDQTRIMGGLLERAGLHREFLEKNAADLSVGEQQRVAIARSLVLEPEVLLLDEPTSALDPTSAQIIEQLILSLSRDLHLTFIIVTHNPEQAKRMGGETLLLVKGRLIESGRTEDILDRPQSESGRKYINRELI